MSMSMLGSLTTTTPSIPEITERNLNDKLDNAEIKKLNEGFSTRTSVSGQDLGKATDDIMMSEEAQEEMIHIGGTKGNDKITASINEENGNIIFNINGEEQEYTQDEAANGFKIDTGKGNDSLDLSAIMGNFVIDAGEGDNELNLGKGRNIVNVGNGNNTITSDGAHRNNITTGNGDNTINLTGDINTVKTGKGEDSITVTGNDSKVDSGAGSDIITTGGDINNVDAGKGDDIIIASGKRDAINAGKGNDKISAGNGDYTIDGGAGNDTIKAGKGNNNIEGGKGDDKITIGDGNNTINGGKGDDKITVGNGNNTIDAGKGDDNINAGNGRNDIYGRDGNDKINAGNGDNYIEGGKGNDAINAGNGNNVIYGLDGKDNINAGTGDNYIDGGKGNDNINAGDGKNIIFGGKGIDNINTDSKTSKIWDDNLGNVNAGDGSQVNRYNYFENAGLGNSISIKGDSDFKMRIESDMESYKHLQTGQKMLSELDNSGHKVDIQQTTDQNGYATAHDNDKSYVKPDGTRGEGSDTTISYNPSFRNKSIGFEPLNVLFHEMAHSYDNATGTKQPGEQPRGAGTVNRREHQAVGLPVIGGIDVQHPDGTVTSGNPEGLTENAIRNELGIPERTRY